MIQQSSTYFDFKNQIESFHQDTKDRIDFLEIYVKRALKDLDELNSLYKSISKTFNDYVNDADDFNMWYSRQNIFKKIWWNIRKYDFEHLKQLKKKDGNI